MLNETYMQNNKIDLKFLNFFIFILRKILQSILQNRIFFEIKSTILFYSYFQHNLP